ncbi:hypothetical protein BDW62DRAFT_52320 [Aspergillus aurantiobrunneus]
MLPADPVSSSTFDQFHDLTTAAGCPTITTTTADAIDWAALGCLPGSSPDGLSEHPTSLESQGQGFTPSVDPPDPLFDNPQPTTAASSTKSNPSLAMRSATSLPTPSPASRESSPKENPSRVTKRQLNTMAARRYRQRRLDRMTQLEEELEAVKRERDELKMRVSKLEGETEALRSMVKEKS